MTFSRFIEFPRSSLHSTAISILPCVASVVSLGAARCLIQRRSNFQVLKGRLVVHHTVGMILDAERLRLQQPQSAR